MKINKQELITALERVKPGLGTNDKIKQSTSFAFLGDKVVTYNDKISISHPIEGLDLTGVIASKELYSLLKRIKADEINITSVKNEIKIKAGPIEAGLRLEKEVKLPLEDELSIPEEWNLLPDNFVSGLKFCMGCASSDFAHPILTCVHVLVEGSMEASDNLRIARYTLQKKLTGVADFLIPAKSCAEVVKLNPSEIAETKGWMHFKTEDGTILSCRVWDDAYVDIGDFLEVEGVPVTFTKEVIDALSRASIFSKRDSVLDEEVEIAFKNKRIVIQGSSDVGWIKETIRTKYDDQSLTFTIAPYLLKDILKETDTCILSENRMKFSSDDWEYVGSVKNMEE